LQTQLWQSRVEIEHYSVAYFDRIAAFEALYRRTSVKGGAHTRWVNSSILATFTQRVWAPPLTEVLRCIFRSHCCVRSVAYFDRIAAFEAL